MTVWVAADALAAVREEAARHAEAETGGMLLGYRAGDDAVVVAVVGPGPAALRTASTFLPDAPWQQDRLAEVYAASGRTAGYLGDWHTHPGGRPEPPRPPDAAADRRAPPGEAARAALRRPRARRRRPPGVLATPRPVAARRGRPLAGQPMTRPVSPAATAATAATA